MYKYFFVLYLGSLALGNLGIICVKLLNRYILKCHQFVNFMQTSNVTKETHSKYCSIIFYQRINMSVVLYFKI